MNLAPGMVLWVACAMGCSATVISGDPGDGARADGGDSAVGARDAGDTGVDIPYFDTNVYDVYRGNPCPGTPPPPVRMYTCDPLNTSSCPAGQSCYPSIDYPTMVCGVETYRTDCFPAGTSGQDTFCMFGTQCRVGFSCFVTGAMNRCLRLCRLDGRPPQCDNGTVCEISDIPDFGACQ